MSLIDQAARNREYRRMRCARRIEIGIVLLALAASVALVLWQGVG